MLFAFVHFPAFISLAKPYLPCSMSANTRLKRLRKRAVVRCWKWEGRKKKGKIVSPSDVTT